MTHGLVAVDFEDTGMTCSWYLGHEFRSNGPVGTNKGSHSLGSPGPDGFGGHCVVYGRQEVLVHRCSIFSKVVARGIAHAPVWGTSGQY